NIFDFLNRDLRTYLPELSSAKIVEGGAGGWRARLGLRGASLRMLRKSRPFWKTLGDYGIFSTILRVPITFPPEKFFGLSLSAMCTPDLRGTQGTFTLFTNEEAQGNGPGHAEASGSTTGGVRIAVERHGNRIEAWLPGPPNSPGRVPAEFRTLLKIEIDPSRN